MKKFFSMMVALAAIFSFTACEETSNDPQGEEQKTALEKPVLSITNQTEDSFTIAWNEVKHAEAYFVELRGVGEEIEGTEKTFSGLAAGRYVVSVTAVAKKDSKYTDSETAQITCVLESTEIAWEGEWTGTCTKTFTWVLNEKEGYLEDKFTDSAQDVTISIEPYEDGAYLIYGLSKVYPEMPALAIDNGDDTLSVLAGVAVGDANNGYTPTWVAYCDIDGDDARYFIPSDSGYEALRLTKKGNAITSEWVDVELSDGSMAHPVQFDIYAQSADLQVQIYGTAEDFPMDLYAGDFSFTQSTTASVKKASVKQFPATTMPTVASSLVY